MNNKKIVAIVVTAIALAVVGATWWQRQHTGPSDVLVLHGNVDIRQVSLAFDGSGRVAEMRAQEGDRVQAGAVLAVLDTRTLALQADQAKAQAEAQEQTLLRLRHGARPEEITQARARLAAVQADAARADQDLRRLQVITADTQGRGVSAQDLDRAKSAAQAARAKADEQRDALRLTELGPRKEDIAGAEAQLKASQAQLALLHHQIAQGRLTAPSDAVVRSRLLEPGDMASPQRPVYALALTGPKWVRVYVSEPDLARVKPGMLAGIRTDGASGKPLSGQVGYISPVAEFTPKSVQTEELRTSLVYEVRVVVNDADDALRMGQPATVQLNIAASR